MSKPVYTIGDFQRYEKWRTHLRSRHVLVPSKEDFIAFGGHSRLRKLLPLLTEMEPNNLGPIRLAISESQSASNAKRGSKAKGGRRGPSLKYSVPKEDLPEPFQQTLSRLRLLSKQKDLGLIKRRGRLHTIPAASIHDAEYILRMITKSCQIRGVEPGLSVESVSFWIDDAEKRECGPRGLSCQIGILKRFTLHHEGIDSSLAKTLGELRGDYIAAGKLAPKRKERGALANIDDLGTIWQKAEEIYEEAQKAGLGTFRRYQLFLEAAAIATSVVIPLRISDLHRFEIGTSLKRNASGWELSIKTKKTGAVYNRDEIWPELNPFLDALLMEDAPGGDLWSGYEARRGSPIFSRDGGKTGLSGDWISDVWFEHFGCGEHFIRTIWHETVFDEDDCKEWIALALCGQKSERTANEYRRRNAQRRRCMKGRSKLKTFRNRLANVNIDI